MHYILVHLSVNGIESSQFFLDVDTLLVISEMIFLQVFYRWPSQQCQITEAPDSLHGLTVSYSMHTDTVEESTNTASKPQI